MAGTGAHAMNGNPGPPPAHGTDAAAIEAANRALKDAAWAEQNGLAERAIAAYRRVVQLAPHIHQAHNNLSGLLLGIGQAQEALAAARQALALQPDDPMVNANAGQASVACGLVDEGIALLRKALLARSDMHPLRALLADVLVDAGRLEDGAALFSSVEGQYQNDARFLAAAARLYARVGLAGSAEASYIRLLQLEPRRAATYNDCAQLYNEHTQFSKARELCLKGLMLEPDAPVMWNTLANAQACMGQTGEALQSYHRALELAPALAATRSNLLLAMHYSSEVTPAQRVQAHREFGRLHAQPAAAARAFANSADPGRRLRIGYSSPDFRTHSVAFFFEPLLEHRDREGFEVVAFADVKGPDAVTARLRSQCDEWHSIVNLPDAVIAERVRAAGIDILVDLAGHAGNTHAAALAWKGAPVQVTYCGYPDTTGLEAVDYRITDAIADPPGVDADYAERLVRLPGSFLCFRPPPLLPDITPPPGPGRGHVTFGCFNREFKVSKQAYDLWARILRSVPGSRLVMKCLGAADAGTRAFLLGEFERRGIPAARIELVGFIASQQEHYGWYRQVDVALDTFPYNGTTTTLDSLMMGVPVVTLAGDCHAGRVGASLLTRIGIPEFIARDADEYVALAIELACDPERIAGLHGSLRQQLFASELCDGATFMAGFEFALRGMWANWCRRQGATLTPRQQAMAAFDFSVLRRS